jgi:hypothetical protein
MEHLREVNRMTEVFYVTCWPSTLTFNFHQNNAVYFFKLNICQLYNNDITPLPVTMSTKCCHFFTKLQWSVFSVFQWILIFLCIIFRRSAGHFEENLLGESRKDRWTGKLEEIVGKNAINPLQ